MASTGGSIRARAVLVAVLSVVACAGVPVLADTAAAAPPPLFQSETLIGGLDQPTTLQFLPDGRMLILEREGDIELVLAGGTQVQPTPFLRLTNVNSQFDRGLVGITLDPSFATNGWYYVYYSQDSPLRERVSRFTASGNGTVPGSEMLIWQDNRVSEFEHHGGTLAFGPDGMLYVSVGDHFIPNDAQLLNNFHGKILRMRADGTVPTNNPFYDGTGPNADAIWAYGLRNPFRFSFDTATGRMYIGDVGGNETASATEEVHVGVAGANYGWPICEGVCSTPGMTNPIFTYPHGGRDAAVTGGFVYRGNQFPSAYVGTYFYGDYVRNYIRRLTLDGNGNVTGNVNFEPANGTEDGPYGEIVDIKQGPEGALYYVDIGISWQGAVNPGTIRRIRYTATNQPPVVVANATPTSGAAPLSVAFSSTGSSDPEGGTLTYSWAFGDGQTSNQPNPTHVYSTIGNYTARLTLSDGTNQTISAPIAITAGNRPQATITTPTTGSTFRAGDTISFSGTGSDLEDGALPASAYSWTVLFLHESHTHPGLPPVSGVSSGSFPIPTSGHDFSGNTAYQVVLTVTDSDGLQNSSAVTIVPEKVNLTFTSVPPGRVVTIDGLPRTTPYVHDSLVNFTHTIAALDQSAGGSSYTFASWSDSGAQTHNITVPATNRAYAATFNASAPSQLLAAYGLNEGSGPTSQDTSGNANTLTLTSTTWTTAGRSSNALSFNGTSSRARTASTVALGSQFTIEAWVLNPANTAYETIASVGSNRDLYLNNGTLGFWNGTSDVTFAGAVPVNTWTHVALTSDGASLRAYVNGVQQGATQNVALPAFSGQLQLGSWITGSSNADFLGGTIDEVRVYNRALAVAEIQADMVTPVSPPPPDTVAPVVSGGLPTGTLPAGTTSTALQVTTNESATCRYAATAGTAYAQMATTFATTGGTAHSHPVTGLANGQSYTFYVRCQDPAGNATTADTVVSFAVANPPAPDTVPPTVALTAPAAGATVSGSVNVTASASDNVAVVGVQFLLDGANLGAEDTTAPYSVAWNTVAATNGSHTLTARARDAAANTTTSAARTVTVANAPATGPVAAYAFDEGAGTTVADASGSANNGTVSGAVWAPGRSGGALRFDGTNDLVTVPDAASLDLTTAMTLEAWVNPAAVPSNWRSIVAKERATNSMTYQLAANSNSNVPATRGYISNGVRTLEGGTRLTAGAWVHLAATYDGAMQRLFVNGVQVSSRAQTGTITVTTNALRIGGSTTMSQYFNGTIDEVRVYNRALAVAEIQADMVTPVSPPPPDTVAPVVSGGLPTGTLPAGTTSTALQVTTNESATCRYAATAGTAYAQMATTFATTGATAHSHPVTGLANGQSYTFYVRCQDPAGNATTADTVVSFAVANPPAPDTVPPTVALTAPAAGATVSGSVNVTASASDNVAVVGVQFLLDGANLGAEDTTAPYSVAWNTVAATNGSHTLTARARDAAANTTTSAARTVTVANAPATGPVAAYAFDEGAGTTVADASPSAVNATATSPTWTASGRYGAAITFNGTSTRVARNSALTLPGAFTIEAWVLNPANTAFETIASVGSTRDLYLGNGTITFWNGTSDLTFGALPVNTWTHVAFVSTGTNIAVYVNGTQQGTTQNVSLASVTATLQVGAWANGAANTDFLGGTIDEVRVYNRALVAAQIQTDMATPITAAAPDTVAPVVSGALPTGTLPTGTTSTTLQVTTNESATCRYATTAGTAYAQMATTFATTGATVHSHPITGLANGQSYTFYVRCQDAAGNATTSDALASFAVAAAGGSGNQFSMQFFGTGTGQNDRVEIPLTPNRTIDVGGDFTLEWWMQATPGNASGSCVAGGTSWVNGNILIDRDVNGPGDFGDYGVSLFAADGRIAFGVSVGTNATTLCSTVGVNDGIWHHVAVTRNGATGALAIFIDGVLSGSATGPAGDVSYRDGRATSAENDPFLVLGAEKHDFGTQFPSYSGLMDELRVSNTVRYASSFARPLQLLVADAPTVALYRFDEGAGTVLTDATGGNNGVVQVGGNPSGPVWSTDRPF